MSAFPFEFGLFGFFVADLGTIISLQRATSAASVGSETRELSKRGTFNLDIICLIVYQLG